ncbi:hypothetical protein F2P56_017601 [Juglans regia]|uniref:Uncharacterized protein n=1 Tax=Juglans regia TaxID=51240 RepID=A0A833X644_JUGRE|nr:hypothetical protein F2P56_017601 [Juglans regia]
MSGAGLKRCGKSCRLRWMNYLRPGIKRGIISEDEEELIVRLHKLLGNRWPLIAGRLPGRTDNEIKNYWNSYIAKKARDQFPSTRSVEITGKKPDIRGSSGWGGAVLWCRSAAAAREGRRHSIKSRHEERGINRTFLRSQLNQTQARTIKIKSRAAVINVRVNRNHADKLHYGL